MICSLGETWISERLMAPWTEKKKKKIMGSRGKKGWDQIIRLAENVLDNLSDVQRLGNVYEKQALMPHSLLSPRSESLSLSQKQISEFRLGARIAMMQQHLLLSSVASWPCLAQRNLPRLICGIKYCPNQLNTQDKSHGFAPAGSFEKLGELLGKKNDIIKLGCLIAEFLRQSKQRE